MRTRFFTDLETRHHESDRSGPNVALLLVGLSPILLLITATGIALYLMGGVGQ